MPHLIVEFSKNVEERTDVRRLVDVVHRASLETGVFPLGGVRTRAVSREIYRIADGDPDNAYVHVVARIREGRDLETRKKAGDHIFNAICDELKDVYDSSALAISFEIQEIDMNMNFKKNNLHERLEAKSNEAKSNA